MIRYKKRTKSRIALILTVAIIRQDIRLQRRHSYRDFVEKKEESEISI